MPFKQNRLPSRLHFAPYLLIFATVLGLITGAAGCAKNDSRRIPMNEEEKTQVKEYIASLNEASKKIGEFIAQQSLVGAGHTLLAWADDIYTLNNLINRKPEEYLVDSLRTDYVKPIWQTATQETIDAFFKDLAKNADNDQINLFDRLVTSRKSFPEKKEQVIPIYDALIKQDFGAWLRREMNSLTNLSFQVPLDNYEATRVSVPKHEKIIAMTMTTFSTMKSVHGDSAAFAATLLTKVRTLLAQRPDFRVSMHAAIDNDGAHKRAGYDAFVKTLTNLASETPSGEMFNRISGQISGITVTDASGATATDSLLESNGKRKELLKKLAIESERLKYDTLEKALKLRTESALEFMAAQEHARSRAMELDRPDSEMPLSSLPEVKDLEAARAVWKSYYDWLTKYDLTDKKIIFDIPENLNIYVGFFLASHNLMVNRLQAALQMDQFSYQEGCLALAEIKRLLEKIPDTNSEKQTLYVAGFGRFFTAFPELAAACEQGPSAE